MKFPITRESLQAFDSAKEQEELKEEELQKHFMLILDSICKDLKRTMSSNSKEKKYVWRNIQAIHNMYNTGIPMHNTGLPHLHRFIEKLKETFIGCDIIMDPLKTYLIIDWS